MQCLRLLFFLFAVTVAHLTDEWNKFKQDYNKYYSSPLEESERRQIFIENVNRIKAYQANHPDAAFTIQINHLTDRRIEELVSTSKMITISLNASSFENFINLKDLPESLDWRTKGVVTPVHNQGLSGEIITAIVSTEVIESLYAINSKNLVEGSIQRVFDCCPQPADPFECIQKLGGICRQKDYPNALGKCEPNKCTPFINFGTIQRIIPGVESYMLSWIQNSTLWAEIDANNIGFLSYSGGVFEDTTCSTTSANHVVQIVGYGIEQGKPYWLCKNSWGETWGDKGYIRIARGKNVCGIANAVIQVANPMFNSSTNVCGFGLLFFMLLLTICIQQL